MPQGNGAAAIPLQPLYQLIQDVHKETVKMNQNMHVLSNKMERMEERMDQMQTSVDQKLTAISKHLQEDKPNMARTDARLDQEVKDRTEKDAELDSRMKEIEAVLVISKMADDVKRKKTGQ